MVQSENITFDIVVVGSGIVGGTLAVRLAAMEKGLRIAVIDAGSPSQVDLEEFDARVVALSTASENILNQVGVWEAVSQQRVCPYREMHVWDGDGTASICFDSDELGQDSLGYIVENRLLTAVLSHRLQQYPHVECFYETRVEALERKLNSGISLMLDSGQSLCAQLVIAADGARSKIRTLAGLESKQQDYGQNAIVTTVKTELPHQWTARQRFSERGPLAFLPLTCKEDEQHYCSIVWSLERDYAEEIMAMNDSEFCSQLAKTFEYRLGAVKNCDARHAFPLVQRHAPRYSDENLILVGDAAHAIHPLAGQGANLGLYDADILCREIARAVSRGLPLSDPSIGKRFERQRKPHNLLAMSTMDVFKRLFGASSLSVRWLRNEGVRAVSAAPWLKNRLARLASGQH